MGGSGLERRRNVVDVEGGRLRKLITPVVAGGNKIFWSQFGHQ